MAEPTAGGSPMAKGVAPAYRGTNTIKALPFNPARLRGLSEKLLISQHRNNYAGAVKRLNEIQQEIGALSKDSPHDAAGHTYWAGDHTQSLGWRTPLLVMDMHEHANQMGYGADAGGYVDAFFQNVNWDEVKRRAESLRQGGE